MTVRARTATTARRPIAWLSAVVIAVLLALVALPLWGLFVATLGDDADGAWSDVLTGTVARALLWEPLTASVVVGLGTGLLSTLCGAFLAWVVVMSDIPGRRTIGALAAIPFALPSFAIALAWESVFRNDRIGGETGLLFSLGVPVPDWLAWGAVPSVLTLTAHYYSLSFVVVAAALHNVGGDLVAAAELTGASRSRIASRIVIPAVTPAVLSGFLLAFAEGVSNFAVPALLGLPVRFQTLSTRLYGAISTGDTARGYVLSIILVVVAGAVLYFGNRLTKGRSFSTITGKATRARTTRTGPWRVPLTAAAWVLVGATAILPGVILAISTVQRRTNTFDGGLTWHYWIGRSDPAVSHGMRGVLRNPEVLGAFWGTIRLGLAVALGAVVLAVLAAYVVRHMPRARVANGVIGNLSYVPFLIPGVALGAAFIAQFGTPVGPFPSLYGTFWILVLAGIAASLPFAFQTATSAMGQVSRELDDAALMTGASAPRRFGRITAPLVSRGLLNGGLLVFVTMVRDLSVVVLLVTPANPLLSMMTFQYASEGFRQQANAITLVIAAISVVATLAAQRLGSRADRKKQA
ncbi:ABC transporter permease [Georgenia alba]|uniref:ABC transporter permease n=1 Tax=Georgenia alba TaxID=2233858 RepID=A0ABW2Q4M4_9MICO